MTQHFDHFFLSQPEPNRGCLLALRSMILTYPEIAPAWKYGMPFFCVGGKMFCYLWIDKKQQWPYLGVVEGNKIDHPLLVTEKRSRMKIMLFDPQNDLPAAAIDQILQTALKLYK